MKPLIAEIPTMEDDSSEKDWIQTVIGHLVRLGWIQETDVIDSRIEFLDYAYPVLDTEYPQKIERIMQYLNSFQNLKLTGRNSLFQYAHFHDMMLSGREVIDGHTH